MIGLRLTRLTLALIVLNGFLLACYLVGIRNPTTSAVITAAEDSLP